MTAITLVKELGSTSLKRIKGSSSRHIPNDFVSLIRAVSRSSRSMGERMIHKPYPKDDEPRTFGVREQWIEQVSAHMKSRTIGRDDLLFTTEVGTPISRNTFRTRVWLPAVRASGVDFNVRVHDLRHAHASWLLAGGSDLKSVMDRMGHAQIQTTQKFLHALPDADQKNLDALNRIKR